MAGQKTKTVVDPLGIELRRSSEAEIEARMLATAEEYAARKKVGKPSAEELKEEQEKLLSGPGHKMSPAETQRFEEIQKELRKMEDGQRLEQEEAARREQEQRETAKKLARDRAIEKLRGTIETAHRTIEENEREMAAIRVKLAEIQRKPEDTTTETGLGGANERVQQLTRELNLLKKQLEEKDKRSAIVRVFTTGRRELEMRISKLEELIAEEKYKNKIAQVEKEKEQKRREHE